MDRKIEKKKWPLKKVILFAFFALWGVIILYILFFADKSTKLNVEVGRLSISSVEQGKFQDYITITGAVQPIQTIFLDVMEGGRVEEIFIEEGQIVEKGDPIVRLSNINLHLNIMNREAELAEQMNSLRNTRLLMQQNQLDLKKQMLEINYLLGQQRRKFGQTKQIFEKGLISQEEFDDVNDNYIYYQDKRDLLIETQRQDSLFRQVQIEHLEASVMRMEENLNLVRKKLENLTVSAPVSGQLASLSAEMGEAKSQGQRLGQINVLTDYKIRADVDEHYISRINRGLQGNFDFADSTYNLELSKIYPEVNEGRFATDFIFLHNKPSHLRIGQTFRVKLELGETQEAILLPRGGFFQKTGGQWIFVVSSDGKSAEKRPIRLGRQNPLYYEVLDGLEPGDRVVTSGYSSFGNAEKLIFK